MTAPSARSAARREDAAPARASGALGGFGRLLSLWVALAMGAGVALGSAFPARMEALSALEWGRVNLLVALLVWAMIFPMMVDVDPAALRRVAERPRGLALTLLVNWA